MPQLYWNDPWSNIAYQNSVDTSDAIDIYDEEVMLRTKAKMMDSTVFKDETITIKDYDSNDSATYDLARD